MPRPRTRPTRATTTAPTGRRNAISRGPTVEPTPTPPPRLAPGLTADGVANPSALAAAHDTVLRNISFTRRAVLTVTYRNETVRERRRRTTRVGTNHEHLSIVASGPGVLAPVSDGSSVSLVEATRNEVYSTGGRAVSAVTRADGTTRYSRLPTDRARGLFGRTDRSSLAAAFDGTETRVDGRTSHNGTTIYRVVGTESAIPFVRPFSAYGSPRRARLRALVDKRGLVRERRVTYTATAGDGSTVNVVRSVAYERVGATTVERPPWYDEVAGNATAVAGATSHANLARSRSAETTPHRRSVYRPTGRSVSEIDSSSIIRPSSGSP